MKFLHYEVDTDNSDVIEVTLDGQGNDRTNFANYQSGRRHRYFGGLAKVSPLRLVAPHAGHWYVVVDLGGYTGSVRASVRIVRAS